MQPRLNSILPQLRSWLAAIWRKTFKLANPHEHA
jgi:hypothetical protein